MSVGPQAFLMHRNRQRKYLRDHAHTTVTYSVRVTATNAGGSNTKTRTNYISVTR